MNKRSIVIFLVFFLALAPVFASQLITYQGRIGQNGQALSSGNITVYLYDQAAGGSLVWSDTFTDSIINGYFDVVLGSGNALNIIYGRRYFLDMDVNGQDINWSGSDRVELEAGVGTISNVSINTSEIQQRVTSACGAGWYLRQINEDGSVVCEEASQGASASSGWNKSGTDVYLYNTGDSVGIGTTSPGAKLEVNGTIRTNITSCSQALETDGSGNMVCGVDDDTTYTENDKYLTLTGTIFGLDESVLNTTIDNKITASDNGWSSDGTTTNTSLNVDIGSGSLFVNSISGLVGIGNTGPDTKLHITGGLCIDTDTVCTDPGPGNANVTGWLDANQLCIASDCKASWAAAANDTNAKTLCLDGEYLRGEAATTCRTAAGIVSDGGGSTFGASVDDTEMTAEDFGDWTCTGLEDGCTIDSTTSANWANKVSDETGSTGNWVFSAGPAFTGETSVTGTSTSWGTVPTAGWKTTMGTSTSATWLAYGESSNTFRGGLQLLDSGGSMRIYVGSGYISISSAGDLTVAGGDITFGTTPISEADIGIINDGVIALTTETSGNYVANVSGGTAITVTGADGEGATKTVAVTNDAIGDTQLAFNTGQHLNITSNVDFNQMDVTDYITASGGIHIGGISDPGTDNLIVDGNVGIGISNPTEKLTLGGGNFLQTAGTPKHAGNLSDGVGGAQLNSPWDVFVAGKYAYITAYGSNALEIVDISDPTNPTHAGNLSDGVSGAQLGFPRGIYISGKYAYIAAYGSNALEIVDISDPTNPTHAGNLSDGVGGAQLTDPADVYVSGNYAYIVSDTDDALEIVDISDPTNPTHAASFSDGVILNRPMNLYISGKYAYITSFSNNSLEIVDISGIDAPAANIGALESSTITVTENADIGNNLYVRNGINVGPAGIKSDGVIVASSLESTAGIKIGNTTTTNAGTIRWTGSDFEGYNGSSWGSLSHTLPAGTIIFFNGTSCPTGFNELTTARGRAIVGLPSSGTLGGTVDTAYSNLEDRTHNHTTQGHTLTIAEMPSHTHTTDLMLNTSKSGGVGWPVGTEGSSTITYPTGGSGSHDHGNTTSNSANIPYIQFLVCIKT